MKSRAFWTLPVCVFVMCGLLGCGESIRNKDPNSMFRDAERTYGEQSYQEAIAKYEEFLSVNLDERLERKATVRLWLCHVKRLFAYQKYQYATSESLLKNFPNGPEPFRPPKEDPSCVLVVVDEYNTYQVKTTRTGDWDVEAPSDQELLRKLRETRDSDGGGNSPVKLLVRASTEALASRVIFALDAGFRNGMEDFELEIVEDVR